MNNSQDSSFPFRTIIYGGLISVLVVFIVSLVLTIFTQFGWTGAVKYSDNLFLLVTYFGVITGSIIAGLNNKHQGWLVGSGVGVCSLFLLLLLTMFLGEKTNWGFFTVKTLISAFIGTFGGIIGVNFSGNRN